MPDEYLIWSWEHCAWWRPNRLGYTKEVREAGIYTLAEAAEITCPHFPPGEEVAVLRSFIFFVGDEKMEDFRPPTYGCD